MGKVLEDNFLKTNIFYFFFKEVYILKVSVDGEEKEIKEGQPIKEVLNDHVVENNYSVAVLRNIEEFKEQKKGKFEIKTNKGQLTLSLNSSDQVKYWKKNLSKIKKSKIRWASNDIVAIGPFSTEIEPQEQEQEYSRGDVFFGLSGMNNDNTYLMLSKRDHSEVYGVEDSKIGRVRRGKHLLDRLGMGDKVNEIKNVEETKREVDSSLVKDFDLELKNPVSIYTNILVQLYKNSPKSVEHFFKTIRDGELKIDRKTNTYVSSKGEAQSLEKENNIKRNKYSVSIRNEGGRIGNVYFYKKQRPSTQNHNVLGEIERGKELINNLDKGNKVKIKTKPTRLLTIGMTQKESKDKLENYEIKQEREGNKKDDAIIVRQEPQETMKVIEKGKVKTIGAERDKIIKVKLFDEKAPETTDYFRKKTGLKDKEIGELIVHFASPEISNVLFKGSKELAGNLSKENNPEESSKVGEIGVTNRAKSSNRGSIGIRLEESKKFGPTSENFSNTNIVGEVKGDVEKLGNLSDGDLLYLKEE